MTHSNRLRSLLATGALATAIALGMVQPAHATLTNLTVKLSDDVEFVKDNGFDNDTPGFDSDTHTLTDTVAVIVPGKEIFAGDPKSNIGMATPAGSNSPVLMANEYVDARPTADDADANRIVLGLEAGATVEDGANKGKAITGYSPNAYYSFSNFVFSTPSIVTGVKISSVDIDGLGVLNAPGGQISFTGGVIKVLIGNLFIHQPPEGIALGTITLDLTVQAVPEPGAFALIGVGLGVIAVVRRIPRRI